MCACKCACLHVCAYACRSQRTFPISVLRHIFRTLSILCWILDWVWKFYSITIKTTNAWLFVAFSCLFSNTVPSLEFVGDLLFIILPGRCRDSGSCLHHRRHVTPLVSPSLIAGIFVLSRVDNCWPQGPAFLCSSLTLLVTWWFVAWSFTFLLVCVLCSPSYTDLSAKLHHWLLNPPFHRLSSLVFCFLLLLYLDTQEKSSCFAAGALFLWLLQPICLFIRHSPWTWDVGGVLQMYCLSDFSVMMAKHHNQGKLRRKHLMWACSLRWWGNDLHGAELLSRQVGMVLEEYLRIYIW